MKDPTVRGIVHVIEPTKSFGTVDELGVGDEIEVTYRLSGRR